MKAFLAVVSLLLPLNATAFCESVPEDFDQPWLVYSRLGKFILDPGNEFVVPGGWTQYKRAGEVEVDIVGGFVGVDFDCNVYGTWRTRDGSWFEIRFEAAKMSENHQTITGVFQRIKGSTRYPHILFGAVRQ